MNAACCIREGAGRSSLRHLDRRVDRKQFCGSREQPLPCGKRHATQAPLRVAGSEWTRCRLKDSEPDRTNLKAFELYGPQPLKQTQRVGKNSDIWEIHFQTRASTLGFSYFRGYRTLFPLLGVRAVGILEERGGLRRSSTALSASSKVRRLTICGRRPRSGPGSADHSAQRCVRPPRMEGDDGHLM